MQTETRVAQMGGTSINYDVCGIGDQAIVFVHGWSDDRTHWREQMEALESGWRLLAVDLLGHGESDAPDIRYSMDLFARGVAAAMDNAGIESAILVGHSNGVPVIRQFYRLFPERVEGLVFADGPLQPPGDEQLEWMRSQIQESDYDEMMRSLAENMPRFGLTDTQVDRLKSAHLRMPRHVMLGGLEAMGEESVWAEDPIAAPLLVVNSGMFGPTAAQPTEMDGVARRLAPHAMIERWDDASHFLVLQHPDRFKNLLQRFLRSVHGGG